VAFKVSRSGVMLVIVALLGTLFAAMPLMGLGADVSPEADSRLEQRYGNIGIGLALLWTAAMVVLAVTGVAMQFRPPRQRTGRRSRR
jgi:hypothetical protein